MACGCKIGGAAAQEKTTMEPFRMRVRPGYRPGVVARLLQIARRAVERCDRLAAVQAIVAAQVAAGYRADVILATAMVDKRLDAAGCDPAESRTRRNVGKTILGQVVGGVVRL